MTNRITLSLLGLMMLAACREKADRPAPPPPSAAMPAESTPGAGPSSGATPPTAASPFPSDQDTARFATEIAGSAGAVPPCGSGVPRITGDSIGPFRLHESLEELTRRCPRLLYGWVLISDGYAVPTVAARLGGATLTAFVSDTLPTATLYKVELGVAGPKTMEGLGVGSTLRDLQRAYGSHGVSESDCLLRVWFASRPGLAFHMEYPPSQRRECGALSEEPLSPDLGVASVILVER